jgi:hypothetical protein
MEVAYAVCVEIRGNFLVELDGQEYSPVSSETKYYSESKANGDAWMLNEGPKRFNIDCMV